jgi:site-specific recombinase XerD
LRFLTLTGHVPAGLERALSPIRAPRTFLSRYLSADELRKLLGAFDPHQTAGIRDYAMTLLAAKLGLRAREIAQLSLEDVDWQTGTLTLRQTKGRRSRLLPLPATVGSALAKYACRVRVRSSARQLFLCLHRPRPLSASAVSAAAAAAFARAGLHVPRAGTHLLRHTLATHLVQHGASLKAIADVLGHRDIDTTRGYLKVNLPMLGRVAQPWPGVSQ